MDWITGFCLAVMHLIGIQVSPLQAVRVSSRRSPSRLATSRYSDRCWAIHVPLFGELVISVDSLRETLAGSFPSSQRWLTRRRRRLRSVGSSSKSELARSSLHVPGRKA